MKDSPKNSTKNGSSSIDVINGVNFTPREIDILACILGGRTAKKIASSLSLSPRTVENYTRNIMLKLECNSRESIIDFLEKSDKILLLRQRYATLFSQHNPYEEASSDLPEEASLSLSSSESPYSHQKYAFIKRLKGPYAFFGVFFLSLVLGVSWFIFKQEHNKTNSALYKMEDSIRSELSMT